MKKNYSLMLVLTVTALALSACGAAATPNVSGGRVEAIPVAFIGTIDSIANDQWVISGTTVTVDQDVIRDGPFNIGDQVKVEGVVNADGSFLVSRVEVPSPEDAATLPQFGDINANDTNVNDGNINADNSNSVNSNDDNSNTVNSNDDNGNDDNSNDVNSNDDSGGSGNSGRGGGDDDNENGGGDNSNDD